MTVQVKKPPAASRVIGHWAERNRLAFEVALPRCERCGGEMMVDPFVATAQSDGICHILEYLGVSTVVPRAPGPPE